MQVKSIEPAASRRRTAQLCRLGSRKQPPSRNFGPFRLATLFAVLATAALAESPPVGSPAASSSPTGIVNPNTTPTAPQPQQGSTVFDVKKLAAMTRPAVALVTVLDKDGKLVKAGTGFFVSADGKLVTNAHVIEGAATADAKLENGATYQIRGVLKPAIDKDLLLLQAEAKDVPFLPISRERMPEVGSRVAVIGSPFGLEGSVSEGIISGHRDAKKDDQWVQMTAPVSPGSSGSPVVDENGPYWENCIGRKPLCRCRRCISKGRAANAEKRRNLALLG
jgi:S1-C subfamily serine protease